MKIDYDIVIIGNGIDGYQAALAASQLKAKVALVQPQVNYKLSYHYFLMVLSNLSQQCFDIIAGESFKPDFYINNSISNTVLPENYQAFLYAQEMAASVHQVYSVTDLATQGVDVIFGKGYFPVSSQLCFLVNERILKSRTYLLACGSRPKIPDINGLDSTGYLTLDNFWQCLESPNPPKNFVILGGLPQSIEVAQTLAKLDFSIDLILSHTSIFSYLDPEIGQLLIAQLEADGVRVFNGTMVTQVRRIEDKKWVQVGSQAIEADEIIVAVAQQPNMEDLNLAAVGVSWNFRSLIVNQNLQTTNPRIYGCGDVLGGYNMANFADYEAKIAVKNALFFPRFAVNYNCIPWIISSQPTVAQVGLTEVQAKRGYGRNHVLVLKHYFKTIIAAQLKNELTGICKLIVLKNGQILGCSIFGSEAGELINLVALAMSKNLRVDDLQNLAVVYPSFAEILQQTAREWSKQKLSKNYFLQEFLQSFFHFRRDWNL